MSKVARLEVIPIAAPVQTADDLDGTTETVIVKVFDVKTAVSGLVRPMRQPRW
jgi:hypothetical protein